ncbi:MAG: hypothetical protein KJZ93_19755 [Caldilineaceae bacterium]|nr:hypothetical protein [Caldilineaceae bacterium]
MTLIQRLVVSLLPKRWSDAIRAESQSWVLRCSVCGTARSVWDMGGIRYKAASVGRRVVVRCGQCGKFREMSLERKPTNPL